MLVTRPQLNNILAELSKVSAISLDCEATGLRPYQGDRLFSIIIGDNYGEYYFNFNDQPDHLNTPVSDASVLDIGDFKRLWEKYFNDSRDSPLVIYLHNAKYDMHLLSNEGIRLDKHTIHCTQAIGRLENNDRLNYSLDALAKACLGKEKDDTVKKYITKNKLFTWHQIPGKKKRDKHPHYDQVPLHIMQKYGEIDARLTYDLGVYQSRKIKEYDDSLPSSKPKLWGVVENERRLTQTLFRMERRGILIDSGFTQSAFDFEKQRIETSTCDFKRICGIDFKDSNKVLAQAFTSVGENFPTTEKGNPSFKDDVLGQMESPLAKTVQEYRDANKKAFTYYANYLDIRDSRDRIHGNARQGGTATGRMSYADPNLQQVHKIEKGDPRYTDEFLARRCFIPDPDSSLLMIDYDQMEYRLMLDYAQEMDVIEEVLAGKDVHQATADIMGVTRTEAKTINFMLLYGGGVQKLADALGCSYDEAYDKREAYFTKLPNIKSFVKNVISTCKARGYVFNWFGRRLQIQQDFAYKAPNYLIQGGCADIVKIAMNRLEDLLAPTGSRLLVQVHDEILFRLHKSDHELVPQIKNIMEKTYPHRYLPLTVGVDYSDRSWQDKLSFEL